MTRYVFLDLWGSALQNHCCAGSKSAISRTRNPEIFPLLFAAAPGDGKEQGLNRLAKPGLVGKAIGGHWSLVPKLGAMAVREEIEAYNLPLGCISQLYRDIAAGKPGMFSKVGLHTFVDPRQSGGAINSRTTEPASRSQRTAR